MNANYCYNKICKNRFSVVLFQYNLRKITNEIRNRT